MEPKEDEPESAHPTTDLTRQQKTISSSYSTQTQIRSTSASQSKTVPAPLPSPSTLIPVQLRRSEGIYDLRHSRRTLDKELPEGWNRLSSSSSETSGAMPDKVSDAMAPAEGETSKDEHRNATSSDLSPANGAGVLATNYSWPRHLDNVVGADVSQHHGAGIDSASSAPRGSSRDSLNEHRATCDDACSDTSDAMSPRVLRSDKAHENDSGSQPHSSGHVHGLDQSAGRSSDAPAKCDGRDGAGSELLEHNVQTLRTDELLIRDDDLPANSIQQGVGESIPCGPTAPISRSDLQSSRSQMEMPLSLGLSLCVSDSIQPATPVSSSQQTLCDSIRDESTAHASELRPQSSHGEESSSSRGVLPPQPGAEVDRDTISTENEEATLAPGNNAVLLASTKSSQPGVCDETPREAKAPTFISTSKLRSTESHSETPSRRESSIPESGAEIHCGDVLGGNQESARGTPSAAVPKDSSRQLDAAESNRGRGSSQNQNCVATAVGPPDSWQPHLEVAEDDCGNVSTEHQTTALSPPTNWRPRWLNITSATAVHDLPEIDSRFQTPKPALVTPAKVLVSTPFAARNEEDGNGTDADDTERGDPSAPQEGGSASRRRIPSITNDMPNTPTNSVPTLVHAFVSRITSHLRALLSHTSLVLHGLRTEVLPTLIHAPADFRAREQAIALTDRKALLEGGAAERQRFLRIEAALTSREYHLARALVGVVYVVWWSGVLSALCGAGWWWGLLALRGNREGRREGTGFEGDGSPLLPDPGRVSPPQQQTTHDDLPALSILTTTCLNLPIAALLRLAGSLTLGSGDTRTDDESAIMSAAFTFPVTFPSPSPPHQREGAGHASQEEAIFQWNEHFLVPILRDRGPGRDAVSGSGCTNRDRKRDREESSTKTDGSEEVGNEGEDDRTREGCLRGLAIVQELRERLLFGF